MFKLDSAASVGETRSFGPSWSAHAPAGDAPSVGTRRWRHLYFDVKANRGNGFLF